MVISDFVGVSGGVAYRRGMTVDIAVLEFAPSLVGDYFTLFDAAFRDNPDWAGCYCAFYDSPPGVPFDPQQDGPANRMARRQRLVSGAARGLLAYVGAQPVGWCNVAPRSSFVNLRKFTAAAADGVDPAVVMCFVIDPDWRGQGVATALLHGAIEAARRWGSPWLEAYPARPDSDPDGLPWTAAAYKGPLGMYLSAGFVRQGEFDTWLSVRHHLGPTLGATGGATGGVDATSDDFPLGADPDRARGQ